MCDVGNIILNSVLTFASVWIVRKFLDTFKEALECIICKCMAHIYYFSRICPVSQW